MIVNTGEAPLLAGLLRKSATSAFVKRNILLGTANRYQQW
jgi:hypothetical protein